MDVLELIKLTSKERPFIIVYLEWNINDEDVSTLNYHILSTEVKKVILTEKIPKKIIERNQSDS